MEAGDSSSGDWRSALTPAARQRVANHIMDQLKIIFICRPEVLSEVNQIVVRFEEKMYTTATSQHDYCRKISVKMCSMEAIHERYGFNWFLLNRNVGNPSLEESADVGIQPSTPPRKECSSRRRFWIAEPDDTVSMPLTGRHSGPI